MPASPPIDPELPTVTNAEEHFDLHAISVDGERVEFESATVTKKSSWVVALADWIRGMASWRGQIVSKTYRVDADQSGHEHTLRALGPQDQTIAGDFTQEPNSRGADLTGAGELTVTDPEKPLPEPSD